MPADDVRGQGAALPLVFFILLVFAAALLLRAWGPALSEAMLRLSAALLRPLALFAPGYAEAASRISALDPGTVSPSLAFAVLSKSARWYVWILGLPLGFLLFRLGSGISPAEHFRRTLGMRGLLREDMPFNPCVAPAERAAGQRPLARGQAASPALRRGGAAQERRGKTHSRGRASRLHRARQPFLPLARSLSHGHF